MEKTGRTSAGEDVEKSELSYKAGGNVKCYSHFGKRFMSISENMLMNIKSQYPNVLTV